MNISNDEIVEMWNNYVLSCEPKGTRTQECVSHIPSDVSFEGFRLGCLATPSKHTEEEAKREIINRQLKYERSSKEEAYAALDLLKSDLAAERANAADKDAEIKRLTGALEGVIRLSKLQEADLTAAREREEKATRERDTAWMYIDVREEAFNHQGGYVSASAILERLNKARDAYDAGRAADGKKIKRWELTSSGLPLGECNVETEMEALEIAQDRAAAQEIDFGDVKVKEVK